MPRLFLPRYQHYSREASERVQSFHKKSWSGVGPGFSRRPPWRSRRHRDQVTTARIRHFPFQLRRVEVYAATDLERVYIRVMLQQQLTNIEVIHSGRCV
jgi:hypothetical protein